MRSNNLLFLQVHAFLFTKFQFSMISENQMIKLALHIYFFIEFLGFDKLYFVSSQFFFLKKFRWSKPQFSKNFQLFFELRGKFSCSLILKANWHPKNGNEIYENGNKYEIFFQFHNLNTCLTFRAVWMISKTARITRTPPPPVWSDCPVLILNLVFSTDRRKIIRI